MERRRSSVSVRLLRGSLLGASLDFRLDFGNGLPVLLQQYAPAFDPAPEAILAIRINLIRQSFLIGLEGLAQDVLKLRRFLPVRLGTGELLLRSGFCVGLLLCLVGGGFGRFLRGIHLLDGRARHILVRVNFALPPLLSCSRTHDPNERYQGYCESNTHHYGAS